MPKKTRGFDRKDLDIKTQKVELVGGQFYWAMHSNLPRGAGDNAVLCRLDYNQNSPHHKENAVYCRVVIDEAYVRLAGSKPRLAKEMKENLVQMVQQVRSDYPAAKEIMFGINGMGIDSRINQKPVVNPFVQNSLREYAKENSLDVQQRILHLHDKNSKAAKELTVPAMIVKLG